VTFDAPRNSLGIRAAPELRQAAPPGAGWIYAFLGVEVVCQLALLWSALAPGRVVFRSAAFGTSLVFFFIVPGRPRTSMPIRVGVLAILAIVTLSAFNPEGAGPLAAFAHLAFYASIVAPVLWVPRLKLDEKVLERLLIALWLVSTASATAGVLQAYFPGRFQPNIALLAAETGKRQLEGLMIHLSSGDWIPRPMGLTDTPGGAAFGGLYAALLGLGVAFRRPFPYARIAAMGSTVIGAICLYLCQIRSLIVMLGICFVAVILILALAGRLSRSGFALVAVLGLAGVGLYLALSLGGEGVTRRLATLVASDAGTVYYNTRGGFLEHTFAELLPEYPLGAGLGRWGMVNQYFGEGQRSLWAEIQWSAWLYDGGILLLLIYPLTILATIWQGISIATKPWSEVLDGWAPVVAGYNIGALAMTFSYPLFMSTGGIDFWVINATLIHVSLLGTARARGREAAVD
jgi:hypothetical protein